jgi:hypothetical protein
VDHYEEAVVEMLKKKHAGMPVSREHAVSRQQDVVNLMDALPQHCAGKSSAEEGAQAHCGTGRDAHSGQEGQGSRGKASGTTKCSSEGQLILPKRKPDRACPARKDQDQDAGDPWDTPRWRYLNPLGRFYAHQAMHDGVVAMIIDEYGRCAVCVARGWWRPDA